MVQVGKGELTLKCPYKEKQHLFVNKTKSLLDAIIESALQ